MTVKDYMDWIEKEAPVENALDWDNVGLMVGSPSQEVTGVLLCVDLTREVFEEAADQNCNLIITHHPIIFHGLTRLEETRGTDRRIFRAIKENITVLSYHTNLDMAPAPFGINYHLALALGLENIRAVRDGFHYVGELTDPVSASVFMDRLNSRLDTRSRGLYNKGPEQLIKRVGVSCGAYDDELDWISEYGCDALVTGEAKQSALIDLSFENFTVYLSGHYATELPGMRALADRLPGRVLVSFRPAGDGALIL